MKIAVFNQKGGVGKSSLSYSFAKDLDYNYITNDESIIPNIYDKAKIELGEFKIINKCVYDLGGFKTPFIGKLLKSVDKVIIPTINDYNSLLRARDIIEYLEGKNCIVIANMIDSKQDLADITKAVQNTYKVKVLPLKRTKAFKNGMESARSLNEIFNESGLTKHIYKSIQKQYKTILKEIKKWVQIK